LVLDLCTGCGCIAAALVTHLPDGKAVATDASVEALKVARENIRRLGLADRIVLRQGDLFEALAPEETGFDAIVSNPPYIRSEEVPSLSPAVTGYEPRAALDGGPDGLDHIRRIVAGAGNRLRPGGHLGIEVAYNQASVVCDLFEAAGLADVRAVPDGLGHQRVVVGSRPRANAR
jgi:release factor glutamine methyltransferase